MRELQRRLEETEAQMSKILQAMKQVSTKVDEVVTDNVSEEPQPEKSKSEERPVDTEVRSMCSIFKGVKIITKCWFNLLDCWILFGKNYVEWVYVYN